MRLRLERHSSGKVATIGELSINGVGFCHVLEDVIRERKGVPVEKWKVAGETAIPAGTYRVEITYSPRFQADLPLLLSVPGFAGVRIHAGNTHENTEGCLLVGQWRGGEVVHDSRKTLEALMDALEAGMQDGMPITLEIVNPEDE